MMSKFNFNIDITDDDQKLNKKHISVNSQIDEYMFNTLFVDLGLPSGTLWCKGDLGDIDINGNDIREGKGKFYAWGEVEPKERYDYSTYKWFNRVWNDKTLTYEYKLTKYFASNSTFGIDDNRCELEPEDDPVYLQYNNENCHIPTFTQYEELMKYCNFKYGPDFKYRKNKFTCTSKINGNSIIFYHVGHVFGVNQEHVNGMTIYWTNTLVKSDPRLVFAIEISREENGNTAAFIPTRVDRYYGGKIKPVFDKK